MDVCVARQPIFREDKSVHGYELLFRDGISGLFPGIDHAGIGRIYLDSVQKADRLSEIRD